MTTAPLTPDLEAALLAFCEAYVPLIRPSGPLDAMVATERFSACRAPLNEMIRQAVAWYDARETP